MTNKIIIIVLMLCSITASADVTWTVNVLNMNTHENKIYKYFTDDKKIIPLDGIKAKCEFVANKEDIGDSKKQFIGSITCRNNTESDRLNIGVLAECIKSNNASITETPAEFYIQQKSKTKTAREFAYQIKLVCN